MLPDDNEHVADELRRRIAARAKADKEETKKQSTAEEGGGSDAESPKKKKKEKKDKKDTQKDKDTDKDVGKWQLSHMNLAETRGSVAIWSWNLWLLLVVICNRNSYVLKYLLEKERLLTTTWNLEYESRNLLWVEFG